MTAAPRAPRPRLRTGPRRRPGQSLIEFSALAGPLIVFLVVVTAALVYIYQGWGLSQALDVAGRRMISDGYFNVQRFRNEARRLGVGLSTVDDSLVVRVTSASDAGACADTCVYSAWRSPDGAVDGDLGDIELEYGDLVSITVEHENDATTSLNGVFRLPSISAGFTGLAQRDTATGDAAVPIDSGDLRVVVLDQSSQPVSYANVAIVGVGDTTETWNSTGASGRTLFTGLAPTAAEEFYAVEVVKDGYADANTVATVTTGVVTTVTVYLDAPLLVYAYAASDAINLVANNPGFENDGGWTDDTGSPGTLTKTVPDGSNALPGSDGDASGTSSGFFTANASGEGVYNDSLPDLGAGTYHGEVWVRAPAGARLQVRLGSPSAVDWVSETASGSGTWRLVHVTWTTAGATDARIEVRSLETSGVTIGVDEAVVRDDATTLAEASISTGVIAGTPVTTGLWMFSLSPTTEDFPYAIDVSAEGCISTIKTVAGGAGERLVLYAPLDCS